MTETESSADLDKNISVTFYIPSVLRNRTRAAYRATREADGDVSWSDLIRKALVAELERRESAHHGGAVYAGDDVPLRPGRPADGS